MHVDEGLVGSSALRPLDRPLVARVLESPVDLSDVELQQADRAVPCQDLPVGNRNFTTFRLLQLQLRPGLRSGRGKAAQPQPPGNLQTGSDDGIVDDHYRHRCTGNNIEFMGRTA